MASIAPALDRADAERLTTRIRLRLDAIADNYVAVMPMIREAIERRAWSVLGYSGVSQYVSECFGDALAHLGVEVRRSVVHELTAAGMSTRAIAPVVGLSREGVRKDQRAGDNQLSPDLPPASKTPAPETSSPETVTEPLAIVTGIDGKQYERKPQQPRRKPLTDAFFTAVYDTRKRVESLHRLVEDDRWPQNAEKVALRHRNDLLRINDLVQQVINSLPEQESTP